jgi:hypothetical protein
MPAGAVVGQTGGFVCATDLLFCLRERLPVARGREMADFEQVLEQAVSIPVRYSSLAPGNEVVVVCDGSVAFALILRLYCILDAFANGSHLHTTNLNLLTQTATLRSMLPAQ